MRTKYASFGQVPVSELKSELLALYGQAKTKLGSEKAQELLPHFQAVRDSIRYVCPNIRWEDISENNDEMIGVHWSYYLERRMQELRQIVASLYSTIVN